MSKEENNKLFQEILNRKKQKNSGNKFNPKTVQNSKPQKGFASPTVVRKTGRGS